MSPVIYDVIDDDDYNAIQAVINGRDKSLRKVLSIWFADYLEKIKDKNEEENCWENRLVNNISEYDTDLRTMIIRNPFSSEIYDRLDISTYINAFCQNLWRCRNSISDCYKMTAAASNTLSDTLNRDVRNTRNTLAHQRNSMRYSDIFNEIVAVFNVLTYVPYQTDTTLHSAAYAVQQKLLDISNKYTCIRGQANKATWGIYDSIIPPMDDNNSRIKDNGESQMSTYEKPASKPELLQKIPNASPQSVTRERPQLFIILVDHSGSMNEKAVVRSNDGPEITTTRIAAVRNALQITLTTLRKSQIKEGKEKPYFYVYIVGYNGGGRGDGLNIMDLFNPRDGNLNEIPTIRTITEWGKKSLDSDGHITFKNIKPESTTPMKQMFKEVKKIVQHWDENLETYIINANENQTPPITKERIPGTDHFPPIIISLTDFLYDNACTEGNHDPTLYPGEELNELETMKCKHFNAPLVLHYWISSQNIGDSLTFPDSIPENSNQYLKELFNACQVLPQYMRDKAEKHGYNVNEASRALIYNAPLTNLERLLKVGTLQNPTKASITRQTETPIRRS